MTDIILTGAKYLIIILFAYFTYISFRAQRDVPDERKRTAYRLQQIMLFLIHGLAFLSICINITLYDTITLEIGKVIGLYAGQLVYLLVLSCVIPRIASLSRGLNNVMCMFLAIGFIIQTRLDFETSLRQFIICLVSTVIFLIFVFLCKRAKFMRDMTYLYAIIGMALLALVLVLSRVVNGAKLAIDLGFFSFQPAEFVKILFVLFVASAFYKAIDRKTVLITAAVAAVHVLILVFCHDLGTALILFMIYLLMLYAATKRARYLGIGLGALAAGGIAAYFMFSHIRVRISAWQDPWSTIDGNGYQIAQALFAIGTGGWFGSGLFGGAPRTVPMVSNDMVFSAISEELGGIFAILLVLLCLCFVLMIFRVAMRVNNTFYKLLAFGLGVAYGFQVFLTIGGTTKFIPLTGVNLPFISSGGSSILSAFIMLGMIQALYVISEADVEREREMVAANAPVSEFDGYRKERPLEERPAYYPVRDEDMPYTREERAERQMYRPVREEEYPEEMRDRYAADPREYYAPDPRERYAADPRDYYEPDLRDRYAVDPREYYAPDPEERISLMHFREDAHLPQEERIEQMIPESEIEPLYDRRAEEAAGKRGRRRARRKRGK